MQKNVLTNELVRNINFAPLLHHQFQSKLELSLSLGLITCYLIGSYNARIRPQKSTGGKFTLFFVGLTQQ